MSYLWIWRDKGAKKFPTCVLVFLPAPFELAAEEVKGIRVVRKNSPIWTIGQGYVGHLDGFRPTGFRCSNRDAIRVEEAEQFSASAG